MFFLIYDSMQREESSVVTNWYKKEINERTVPYRPNYEHNSFFFSSSIVGQANNMLISNKFLQFGAKTTSETT
jgi:hypothetical protein